MSWIWGMGSDWEGAINTAHAVSIRVVYDEKRELWISTFVGANGRSLGAKESRSEPFWTEVLAPAVAAAPGLIAYTVRIAARHTRPTQEDAIVRRNVIVGWRILVDAPPKPVLLIHENDDTRVFFPLPDGQMLECNEADADPYANLAEAIAEQVEYAQFSWDLEHKTTRPDLTSGGAPAAPPSDASSPDA